MARKIGGTRKGTIKAVHDAACDLLVRDGLLAVSARSIAKIAGVAPSTVVSVGGMDAILRHLTAKAFAPLAVEYSAEGSLVVPMTAIQKRILKIFRDDPQLPSIVTQVCGLACAPPAKVGTLNSFRSIVHDVTKQMWSNVKRDRGPRDAGRLARKIVDFYIGAAIQLTVHPSIKDRTVLAALG